MDLTWLDPSHLDDSATAGAVAVLDAARVVDRPHQLGPTVSAFVAYLRHGWDGDPPRVAVSRDVRGRVEAVLEVWLPRWDNHHLGAVEVTVDPAVRRNGLGRHLFGIGVDRVRREGRRVVVSGSYEGTAGIPFLEALGMKPAATEEERQQHLLGLDHDRLERDYAEALERAEAYDLVRMPGAVPAAQLDDIVAMTASINDAPTDDLDVEDEVFTPERIRAFEAAEDARGRRLYRLVARHHDSGELAGHTMIAVESERPWWGWQFDTSVLMAHRGHRLGLLLKVGMLRWLASDEPQLRSLDTWNAASNEHMVAVNERLGYHLVGRSVDYQQHL